MVNCLRIMIIPMRTHILAAALGVLVTAEPLGTDLEALIVEGAAYAGAQVVVVVPAAA